MLICDLLGFRYVVAIYETGDTRWRRRKMREERARQDASKH
jgi:hypothetical protein